MKSNNDMHQQLSAFTPLVSTSTLTGSLRTEGRRLQAIGSELVTCDQSVRELVNLGEDLCKLLQTEGPKLTHIPEILTRRLSELFPLCDGEDFISKLQYALTRLATFGVQPSVAMLAAKKAVTLGISQINTEADKGKQLVANAVHHAGGSASYALDLYNACISLYSIYNTYTELSRLYASIQFCAQSMYISIQELSELSSTDELWKNINEAFAEYWNQPGFNLQEFLDQTQLQLKTIFKPLEDVISLYESMEPLRISSYLAMTTPQGANSESQLAEVSHLLTNACYNSTLDKLAEISKTAGTALGKGLPNFGIDIGTAAINGGAHAALITCATMLTGMSFPITFSILATCLVDDKKRAAFIAYAQSFISNPKAAIAAKEQKSDTGIQSIISKQLTALQNHAGFLLSPVTESISESLSPKLQAMSTKINQIMDRCMDASGAIVGEFAETAIRTLIQDSDLASLLQEKLDSVIYTILDGAMRQTLQIPEEKVFVEKIRDMSENQTALYEVCGALVPEAVNFLALPNRVEAHLQACTGNPDICSDKVKFSNKTMQTATRVTRALAGTTGTLAQDNIAITAGIIKAGMSLRKTKAIKGPETPSITFAAAPLQLSTLGSALNRESEKGLRVHLIDEKTLNEGTTTQSIPYPAIIFSRKAASSWLAKDSIEIKGFKIAKKVKSGLISTLVTLSDYVLDTNQSTKTILMEDLDKEKYWVSELKIQSENIVRDKTSNKVPATSLLLTWDHPLVKSLTEKLKHQPKRFDYTKQHELQQITLARQAKRKVEQALMKQEADELAKTEKTATECGFGKAFFEDFENITAIQARYDKLLETINKIDAFSINLDSENTEKVKQYIKKRLIDQMNTLLIHMKKAEERFNLLQNELINAPTKTKLALVEKAIQDIDYLGWFSAFKAKDTTEARSHYLALLDIQKQELAAVVEKLVEPLTDLENGKYSFVADYAKNNPSKAEMLLAEVLLHKQSFGIFSWWPKELIQLEQALQLLCQNKIDNNPAAITIHLPQDPVPVLRFASMPKPNNSPLVCNELKTTNMLELS